ncbi:GNAT family N-acetyltransferase [Gudongella sp. SC589]|uniref:GNAT family N-acetyltransferase n=1 Tax=Gudongella sp. SC589 TaxID=3385990 RepID=UPI003904A722
MKGITVNGEVFYIKSLGANDEGDLQDLCERCYEFAILTEGRMPASNAGYDILNDLPPGKDMEDKLVLGVYGNELLIGVVEMVRDYKVPGEWIIGLLLIDPDRRGISLGSAIHDYIREYVSLNGGSILRIGVIEENIKGMNFWKKLGYQEVERKEQSFGNKEHTVIVMNLRI